MLENYPDMIDIPQLCKLLGCGKTKAYQLVATGEFRTIRIGKKMLIPKSDILDFLKKELG